MTFEQMLTLHRQAAPRKRPDDEEHRLQVACVQWFHYQYPKHAHNLFAVPNGGKRDKVTAAKLKAEGALAGVADLILLIQSKGYGALLIEMKTSSGRQADSQKAWQKAIEKDGYKYVICRSISDFITEVNSYMGHE